MKKHLVHGSPWILASACGLLALIIGSFAISNYHREKRLMELSLLQKGESVLRVFDSGLKVSFRGHMMGLSEGRRSNGFLLDVLKDSIEVFTKFIIESLCNFGIRGRGTGRSKVFQLTRKIRIYKIRPRAQNLSNFDKGGTQIMQLPGQPATQLTILVVLLVGEGCLFGIIRLIRNPIALVFSGMKLR